MPPVIILILALLISAAPVTASKPAAPKTAVPAPAPKQTAPDHQTPVAVTFKPTAEVKGTQILLGDVAAVEGEDAALVSSLAAVEIGASPLWGNSRSVSAAYAKIKIRQLNVDLDRVTFSGPALCTVNRPEQIVSGVNVQKAACDAVDAANPDAAALASFVPADLRLPVGAVELKPMSPRMFGTNSGTVVVQVLIDGQQQAQVTVSFRLLRRAPALIAVRDVPLGTVLTEEDLKVEERPMAPGPLVLSDPARVLGRQASVPIKAGTVLTASMVKPALLVKRGTRVKLICRATTFTVTAAGEAMQDGVEGQTIKVRNLTSLLEVTGVATGPQTVEVPF